MCLSAPVDLHVPWQPTAKAWGAEGAYSVVFGRGVVEDLVAGMTGYLQGFRYSSRMTPAALGCVGWLTDDEVVQTLLQFGSCCVVVDKPAGRSWAERKLRQAGPGFETAALRRLDGLQPRDEAGRPRVIGPYSVYEPVRFQSLRVAGYQQEGAVKPLLHAKMLVLGSLVWHDEDALGHPQDVVVFRPRLLWTGSANWTKNARRSIEVGAWINDPALLEHATDFLIDVLALSEPWDSTALRPAPELVAVDYDDDAFADYLAELDPDSQDDD